MLKDIIIIIIIIILYNHYLQKIIKFKNQMPKWRFKKLLIIW
jgi:hypothetical protein